MGDSESADRYFIITETNLYVRPIIYKARTLTSITTLTRRLRFFIAIPAAMDLSAVKSYVLEGGHG